MDLVRAPLRLGLSVAERVLDAGTGVLRGARSLLESEEPTQPSAKEREAEREARPIERAERTDADEAPAAEPERPAAESAAPPKPAERTEAGPSPEAPTPFPTGEGHVDEGAVLAAEAAEAGAEEGAHAELHVEEPWEGYGRMRVDEITSELEGATREALAAVDLYERTHRGRASVLEAADRRLRELSGRGAVAGKPVSGS
jgi:hypothetical protein